MSPTTVFDSVQVSIPVIDEETDLEPQQDNVEQLPTQVEIIIPEEQTQQPQVSLKKSIIEKKNVISDDS